jgi:hypothetical protein
MDIKDSALAHNFDMSKSGARQDACSFGMADLGSRSVRVQPRQQETVITLKQNRQIPPFQQEPEHRIQPHTLWKTIIDSSDVVLHP